MDDSKVLDGKRPGSRFKSLARSTFTGLAELADALDLGSSVLGRRGSSPLPGIMSFQAPLRVEQKRGKWQKEIYVLLDANDKWICATTDDDRRLNLETLAAQFNEYAWGYCAFE